MCAALAILRMKFSSNLNGKFLNKCVIWLEMVPPFFIFYSLKREIGHIPHLSFLPRPFLIACKLLPSPVWAFGWRWKWALKYRLVGKTRSVWPLVNGWQQQQRTSGSGRRTALWCVCARKYECQGGRVHEMEMGVLGVNAPSCLLCLFPCIYSSHVLHECWTWPPPNRMGCLFHYLGTTCRCLQSACGVCVLFDVLSRSFAWEKVRDCRVDCKKKKKWFEKVFECRA